LALCPICQTTIEILPQHHGALFSCPACQGSYFIDWDGNPEPPPPADAVAEVFPHHVETAPIDPVSEVEAPDFLRETNPVEEPPALQTLDDIADYGNSDTSSGPLSYSILVKGIELPETFVQIRDALSDSRFAWDTDKLMESINAGILFIQGVSPTKAALFVNRLRYFPVEISWEQEIYANSDSSAN
jgi:hypothetical protein